MDHRARDILAALKNVNLSVDAKVTHLLGLKSDIKQKNVPEKAVPVIFECLRHAIASPFHALYSAGFSTLGHFLKRLYIQEHHQLVAAMSDRILPALIDRMGDNKDRIRHQTTHALADLWEGAGPQIESLVLSVGFQGKNPFQKQTCLNLLSIALTRSEITAAYAEATAKGYLRQIITFVEDADPTVRQGARGLLVQMFIGERDDSKHDLKRALEEQKVRPSHAREILAGIGLDPDLYDENQSSRQLSIQQRAPSRAAIASRAPSRAGISRAPSRAAMPRAASRAEISRAPSRADTFNERPGSTIIAVSANPAGDDDAAVLHHPQPVRRSPIASELTAASDNRLVVANSIPANEYDSLYSYDHLALTQAVSGPATAVGRPVSVISSHAEQIVQDSISASKQKNTARTNANKASGMVNAPVGQPLASASPGPAHEKAKRVVEPLDIEPYDLGSSQELDRLQATMTPWFDGKETEMNFLRREEYTILIRRITHGNAPQRWPTAYFSFVKSTLPFVFVTANSVRTSLQTAGLRTVQSLARVNKERLDGSVHIILQNVLKLCANAKGITSQNSNLTVVALLESVTCNQRVLNQIMGAAKEKNQNMRIFSAGWLEIIIDGQSRHKTHTDGVNSIAACIQEGVEDAKEDIRRAYRHTFFRFSSVWPARAKKILDALSPKTQKLIEKDMLKMSEDDPFVSSSASSTTGLFSNTPARATVKGATTEKAKANLAAPKAMLSPKMAARSTQPAATKTNALQKKPTSTLSSAPMRPGAAKPRPATAAGFQPKKKENESPRKDQTPSRIPGPALDTPVNRRRQNSDPTLNESPAKSTWVACVIDDHPIGPLTIPKRRSIRGTETPRAKASKQAVGVVENDNEKLSETDGERGDERVGEKVEEKVNDKVDETADDKVDEKVVEKRRVSISDRIISSAQWPSLEIREPFSEARRASMGKEGSPRPEREYVDSTMGSEPPLPKRVVSLWSQNSINARGILLKGIERIQARTMATDGFRKLQGLIQHHPDLFVDEEQFAVLLIGLLDELAEQAPPSKSVLSLGTVSDHKTQVLFTVKYMFENFKQFFAPYYPGTVVALLKAEKSAEMGGHLIKAIENFIDDVVNASRAHYGIIEAVVTHLGPAVQKEAGPTEHRMLRKGLDVIAHGLACMKEQEWELPPDQMDRLGEFVRQVMALPSVALKRRIFALCITLRELVDDEERFWELVGSKTKGVDGLLFYYRTRQEAQVAQAAQ